MKKFFKAFFLRLKSKHICQHEGCMNEGIHCHLNDYDYEGDYHWKGDLYYWYCVEHCKTEGFCWYCGEFWGGCEAFDFETTGCCANCKDEFKSDLGEDELKDEYDDFLVDIENQQEVPFTDDGRDRRG